MSRGGRDTAGRGVACGPGSGGVAVVEPLSEAVVENEVLPVPSRRPELRKKPLQVVAHLFQHGPRGHHDRGQVGIVRKRQPEDLATDDVPDAGISFRRTISHDRSHDATRILEQLAGHVFDERRGRYDVVVQEEHMVVHGVLSNQELERAADRIVTANLHLLEVGEVDARRAVVADDDFGDLRVRRQALELSDQVLRPLVLSSSA